MSALFALFALFCLSLLSNCCFTAIMSDKDKDGTCSTADTTTADTVPTGCQGDEREKQAPVTQNKESTEGQEDKSGACSKDKPIKQQPTDSRKPNKSTPSEAEGAMPLTKKKKGAEKITIPTTLEGFGYEFINGELRNSVTKERFVFEVCKGDKEYNQKHYEALGEVLTDTVYSLLETTAHLQRITIPVNKKPKEAGSFFFASEDALTNPDKIMVLIHGSGVVRAGQWARRLIINDCLDSGTQLPFIKKAMEEGYGVIVTNGNRNEEEIGGKKTKIRGSKSPEEHAQYLWKHFISKSAARRIDIVAHSYGGVVTVELMKMFFDDFKKRVKKVAFTDSVHNLDLHSVKGSHRRWMTASACNWVTSKAPLDTPIPGPRSDVPRVSAGTLKHEETSFYSFNSIFKYFSDEVYQL